MLVSSVAVSMFSKVPILNSLSVLLVKDGFGNSWICNREVSNRVRSVMLSKLEESYTHTYI